MRLVYLTFLLFSLISCKKESDKSTDEPCQVIHEAQKNDTLKSSAYIAAYPGSNWHYSGNYYVSCHNTETNIYSTITEILGCEHIEKNKVLAPENSVLGKIDSIYEVVTNDIDFTTKYIPIIGFEMGEFYHHVEYNMSEEPKNIKTFERSVVGIYDSLEINGNTYYDLIKVKHLVNTAAPGVNSFNDIKYYTFAKNIGLVRYQYPLESQDIILTSYYINE